MARGRFVVLALLFLATWALGSSAGFDAYYSIRRLPPELHLAGLGAFLLLHYLLAILLLRTAGLRWRWIMLGLVGLLIMEFVLTWAALFWSVVFAGWIFHGFAP
jgi:hypothetical protein